jgi:16S rRNA (uracil1498-N3)-methyltransferase
MTEGDLILFREGFLPTPEIKLEAEEAAHQRARRLHLKDHLIEIRDGQSKSYLYTCSMGSKVLSLSAERTLTPRSRNLSIAIALPKGNRLDFFIQKATEIGITKIYFCVFQHSIRKEFNLDRCKKIVKEAASQSNQPDLMQMEIVQAGPWMEKMKRDLLVFDPHSEIQFSMAELSGKIPIIGPEGGFHSEEIALMESLEIPRLRWDGGVLRTETAGLVVASLLAFGF